MTYESHTMKVYKDNEIKVIRLQKWFKNYILSKKILNTIPNIINDLYSIEGFYGQLARKEFYELC